MRAWKSAARLMPERKRDSERKLLSNLKEVRTKAGLTQAELAELVEVSRKTINTVENGVFVPSTLLALKLAEALGTKVETLFELD